MTPFLYKTKVVDMDSGDGQGFFLVRGREDGSWSIHLHHWDRSSAGCDTPEACYPAALQILAEWWVKLEAAHERGVEAINSWPDRRPGYRPGWKKRELAEASRSLRRTAAAWVTVQAQLKTMMETHQWPTDP